MKTVLKTTASIADADHWSPGRAYFFPYTLKRELMNPIVELENPGLIDIVSRHYPDTLM